MPDRERGRSERAGPLGPALNALWESRPGWGAPEGLPSSDVCRATGMAEYERGHLENALRWLERAVARAPGCPHSQRALAGLLQQLGRHAEAAQAYGEALRVEPSPTTESDLAAAWYGAGRSDLAREACARALAADPRHPAAWNQLGVLYEQAGRRDAALDAFRTASAASPTASLVLANLGRLLYQEGRFADSAEMYARALVGEPDRAAWLNGRALALRAVGELSEAIDLLHRALTCAPGNADLRHNLCELHLEAGHVHAAAALWHGRPLDDPRAWVQVIEVCTRSCTWSAEIDALGARLEAHDAARVGEGLAALEPPLACARRTDDPAVGQRVARSWSAVAARVASDADPLCHRACERHIAPGRTLRLGYLTGDFREHPVAHLIGGVLRRHDRARFEVVGLSYGRPDSSEVRARIVSHCDRFVELHGLGHPEAAARIAEERIDVLVELTTHTQAGRLEIAALRPAPVQIAYLGFPGTTGAAFFDYMIADPFVAPPEQRGDYDERMLYLPHCYQASDPEQPVGARRSRAECGLPEGRLVLGCFCRASKIDATLFEAWTRILLRCPEAVLWLLAPEPARGALRAEAARRGVNPERLLFAEHASRPDHLARLEHVDIALDTRFYGGHTTTSDALWRGVPVVAVAGRHFASRVSSSILRAAGLEELVCSSLAEYVERTLHYVSNPARLASLRARVAAARGTAPYFDLGSFTRQLEAGLLRAFERAAAGAPPADLRVSAEGVAREVDPSDACSAEGRSAEGSRLG